MKKYLVITDNKYLYTKFKEIIETSKFRTFSFDFCCSPKSKDIMKIDSINLKTDLNIIFEKNYEIIFSLHSKQLFPKELISKVKCINIHPGLNPYNRGWYPQVFCIINGLPFGATIHEIDEDLDHGRIIVQKSVALKECDTSDSAYRRVLKAELELLNEHLENILNNQYTSYEPCCEGNLNFKKDFDNLCKIDLNQQLTMKEAIDKLRALTHLDHKNAYFVNNKGQKVFLSIKLHTIF